MILAYSKFLKDVSRYNKMKFEMNLIKNAHFLEHLPFKSAIYLILHYTRGTEKKFTMIFSFSHSKGKSLAKSTLIA